jgi:hypothetical protein
MAHTSTALISAPLGGIQRMTDVSVALSRFVRGFGTSRAVRNAARERSEHARIVAQVDALARRIAPPSATAEDGAPAAVPLVAVSHPTGRAGQAA